MSDKRVIVGHAHSTLAGPHVEMPPGFVPLRLCVEGERMRIEIACPVAVVGRHSEADLRFAYPEISRRHCTFVFEKGQWRIYDLKSLNGILLNQRPTAEATLFAGDRLRIGCVKLFVEAATPKRVLWPEDEKMQRTPDMRARE
jgi:pSer/pThr/pTyr-binding forkhead associated (FHA) protein